MTENYCDKDEWCNTPIRLEKTICSYCNLVLPDGACPHETCDGSTCTNTAAMKEAKEAPNE